MNGMWTAIAQRIGCGKQNRAPYIKAVLPMTLFTFLFLGAEYLFDNRIALVASEQRTVLAQNYALGISAVGFALYPLLCRFLKQTARRAGALLCVAASVFCLLTLCRPLSYAAELAAGLALFLLLGLIGSAVYGFSARALPTNRYLARTVGVSYMLGILLQFANNNFVASDAAQAVLLCVSLPLLVFLLLKTEREGAPQEDGQAKSDPARMRQNKDGDARRANAAGGLLILLVALMTCVFSTLDNAVTLVHAATQADIGRWPRLLLAFSGLAAGFAFDAWDRRFMSLTMFCVMLLSAVCIVILRFGGPFVVGLAAFYVSAGFFAVFFTASFMELSGSMKNHALWAGLGRAVNNLTAAAIAGGSLALLESGGMAASILALVLFAVTSVVTAAYAMQRNRLMQETAELVARDAERRTALLEFAKSHSFTPRETEVFDDLVNTEDGVQAIAQRLNLSRRTLERYISSIYKKTGVKSRVGLIRMYKEE